jgi:hypothetical protein
LQSGRKRTVTLKAKGAKLRSLRRRANANVTVKP